MQKQLNEMDIYSIIYWINFNNKKAYSASKYLRNMDRSNAVGKTCANLGFGVEYAN